MENLKPNQELQALLEKARHYTMSPAEVEAQRQSWVRGEMALGSDADEARARGMERVTLPPERWVTWVEPGVPSGLPVYSFASEVTAIAMQKEVALTVNNYTYKTDQDALADFMAVNWASFTEKPKEIK